MFNIDELKSMLGLCAAARKLRTVFDALGVKQNPEEEIAFLRIEQRINEEGVKIQKAEADKTKAGVDK